MYLSKYKYFNDVIKYECNHFINKKINKNWLEYDYSMINYKIYSYIYIIKNKCKKIQQIKFFNSLSNKQNPLFKKSITYQNLKTINNNTLKQSKSYLNFVN